MLAQVSGFRLTADLFLRTALGIGSTKHIAVAREDNKKKDKLVLDCGATGGGDGHGGAGAGEKRRQSCVSASDHHCETSTGQATSKKGRFEPPPGDRTPLSRAATW